jgi:hypothetical protein
MPDHKVMLSCDLCGSSFQMGPHVYDGKHIARYQITVCRACWLGNWDGWAPQYEKRLLSLLTERGLPVPARNEKGWLPRE